MIVEKTFDVAPVWSGHPARFSLLTAGGKQFVAFYDAQRQMTVASRPLDSEAWHFVKLPERIVWDSHNYITMAVDDDRQIHLSGNMHVAPLVYFRTTKPGGIDTFERHKGMVGDRESRCTYPRFFRGPNNEFIFTYRDGKSGSGDQIYNVYDHATKTWRRLLDQPLFTGKGKMNAYLRGPVEGPDGYYHLCWVWRDTPDCSTNHDLSYARSKDLLHWESGAGKPLKLPISNETGEIVDPIPAKGGIINGAARIGFDSRKRVIISYHKFDPNGITQAYNARLEDGKWRIYQASQDWDYRWYFQGGGSIGDSTGPRVSIGLVERIDGRLVQSYNHPTKGSGAWVLDEETLKPVGQFNRPQPYPSALARPESKFPGMKVNEVDDLGGSGKAGVKYVLRWETLGANRDKPRDGELPPPSMLRVYTLRQGEPATAPSESPTADRESQIVHPDAPRSE